MAYVYPTAFELRTIQQDFMNAARADRVGLQIMPERDVNEPKVRWSQQDNYTGLQQMRGMDGAPLHVYRVGQKTYEYSPGIFGEFVDITETELTERAGRVDVLNTPVDISDLIIDADKFLINRELDRCESSVWTLLTTGVLNITLDGPNGTQIGYSDSYTIQTFTAPIGWATLATATPIVNFQQVQQLGYAAGHSANFGAGAFAYANNVTWNRLLNNSNAADYGGRRTMSGSTINNLSAANSYWAGQNLPFMVGYDNGYFPTKTSPFLKFIPDGKIVVVGQRPAGAQVGEYLKTRNAANQMRPGSYRKIYDRANGRGEGTVAEARIPANVEVHRGHNGGPAIYYPSAIVVMTV